jgi:hypothetical protein
MANNHFTFPRRLPVKTRRRLTLLPLVFTLAACGRDGTIDQLRQRVDASPTLAPATSTPIPQPTETPDFGDAQPALQAPATVEVTRIVVVTAPAITPPATAIDTPTPTPEIQGFDAMTTVDESVQPCPARFWWRRRCVATEAQIEQAAHDAQP